VSLPAGLPIRSARPLGGGSHTEVYAVEAASGPAVLKIARTEVLPAEGVTNGVFFAEGRERHTGSFGRWPVRPNEVVEAEARVLGGIRHPAFPRRLDEGEADGRRWLLETAFEGRTFREALYRDAALEPRHIGQVARALIEARDAGALALHGDLKPDNLLLDAEGAVRVLDPSSGLLVQNPFGEPERLFTTPLYNPGLIASDVPSLGLLLAEVLCRRPLLLEIPSEGPSRAGEGLEAWLARARAVGSGSEHLPRLARLRTPSELAPGVDPELEALALACLGLELEDGRLERVEPPTLDDVAAALAAPRL
jgi:serine/threonine protein kinase